MVETLQRGSRGHFIQPAWIELLEGLSHFGDEAQTLLPGGLKGKYLRVLLDALKLRRFDTWRKYYTVSRNWTNCYGQWDVEEQSRSCRNGSEDGFDVIGDGDASNRIVITYTHAAHAGMKLPLTYKRDQDGNRIRHAGTIGTHHFTPERSETRLQISCPL